MPQFYLSIDQHTEIFNLQSILWPETLFIRCINFDNFLTIVLQKNKYLNYMQTRQRGHWKKPLKNISDKSSHL